MAAAMADPARPRASQSFALGGKSAVWQHPSFVDALADPIAARGRRSGLEPLLRTMRLIGCCLAPNADERQPSLAGGWAPDVQRSWHDATALTESLAQCKPDMKELHVVIESWMNRVLSLRKDASPAIFPIGWRRKHAGQETETAMLGVLSKVGKSRYSLAVCSSGSNEGAPEYLAVCVLILFYALFVLFCAVYAVICAKNDGFCSRPDTMHGGEILRSRSLIIESIPAARIEDSTLWFLLFRPAVFANASNGPQLLFERVLPVDTQAISTQYDLMGHIYRLLVWQYLGERPLLRNTHGTSLPVPRGGDPSQWGGAVEAMKCALTTQGSEAAATCDVLLHGRLLQLACLDVRAAGKISAGNGALLRLSSRTVAALAAIEARRDDSTMELEQLEQLDETLEQLEQCISAAEPDETPPQLTLPQGASVPSEHADFAGFGRFRSDGSSVEALAGPMSVQPIVLPVPLARAPDEVHSPAEAASALRTVYELCVLIENQQESIRDSYLHRAALIRHLFTRVMPLPLPLNHRNRSSWCFWASTDGILLYAQQIELLRLLNKLAEVYASVTLSLPSTNTLDGTRMTVMACITCLADAIVRIHAADAPSMVSQHIGGRDPKTGGAFGMIIHEQYARESENSLYTSAELATARCQVLDYFQSIRTIVKERHVIFDFSSSHSVSFGDMELVKNLCLATGFAHDRSTAAQYITGELRQLLLRFPELEAFRNIAFHWSVLLTANRADLPETRQWVAADAHLQWTVKDESYCVRAFGKQLASAKVHEKSEGLLGRLKDAISGSEKRMPSAADPRSLLGESKAVTEEDILYIRHLPELGGLTASSAELLLQYLTAPFLRIPLVMQFFSDQIRFRALASSQLQAIVDAVLFEPGAFRHDGALKIPTSVPATTREFLGTPCGLLANELQRSPRFILRSILDMAEGLLDMDEGRAESSSAGYVMFAIRLLVRLESFLRQLSHHQHWSAQRDDEKVSGCCGAAAVRGLALINVSDGELIAQASDEVRSVLVGKAHDTLVAWLHRLPISDTRTACDLWGHLALAWGAQDLQGLDEKSVKMLLTAQVFLSANATDSDEGVVTTEVVPRDELADVFMKSVL